MVRARACVCLACVAVFSCMSITTLRPAVGRRPAYAARYVAVRLSLRTACSDDVRSNSPVSDRRSKRSPAIRYSDVAPDAAVANSAALSAVPRHSDVRRCLYTRIESRRSLLVGSPVSFPLRRISFLPSGVESVSVSALCLRARARKQGRGELDYRCWSLAAVAN